MENDSSNEPSQEISEFGRLLDEYRQREGLSKKELGARVEIEQSTGVLKKGICSHTIDGYLSGKRLTRAKVLALGRAMNLSWAEQNKLLRAAKYTPEQEDLEHRAPVVGPPVRPHQFFGRAGEIEWVFRNYWQVTNIVALGARKRSGITSLLHYLYESDGAAQRFPAGAGLISQHHRVYLDFHAHGLNEESAVLGEIVEQIRQTTPQASEWLDFRALLNDLDTSVTIFMDSVELGLKTLPEAFWTGLRAEVSRPGRRRLGLVLSGRNPGAWAKKSSDGSAPSPLTNVIGQILWDLEPFTQAEASQVLEAVKPPFKNAEKAWILQQKRHLWPALLQIICMERQNALQNRLPEEEWKTRAALEIQAEQFNELD